MSAMYVTSLNDCPKFLAGDHTHLRELLHPSRVPVGIRYSLAHGWLDPGDRSKLHRLKASEVYYFLNGEGLFTVGEETVKIASGSVVYVPPGGVQSVENIGSGSLEFICLVDPPWKLEEEEVFE